MLAVVGAHFHFGDPPAVVLDTQQDRPGFLALNRLGKPGLELGRQREQRR